MNSAASNIQNSAPLSKYKLILPKGESYSTVGTKCFYSSPLCNWLFKKLVFLKSKVVWEGHDPNLSNLSLLVTLPLKLHLIRAKLNPPGVQDNWTFNRNVIMFIITLLVSNMFLNKACSIIFWQLIYKVSFIILGNPQPLVASSQRAR